MIEEFDYIKDTIDEIERRDEGLVHLYGQNFGRTKKVGCRGL